MPRRALVKGGVPNELTLSGKEFLESRRKRDDAKGYNPNEKCGWKPVWKVTDYGKIGGKVGMKHLT